MPFNDTKYSPIFISTHTLRGERDAYPKKTLSTLRISTHTLRGERDKSRKLYNILIF